MEALALINHFQMKNAGTGKTPTNVSINSVVVV